MKKETNLAKVLTLVFAVVLLMEFAVIEFYPVSYAGNINPKLYMVDVQGVAYFGFSPTLNFTYNINLLKSTVDQVANMNNGTAKFCNTNVTTIGNQQVNLCSSFIKVK